MDKNDLVKLVSSKTGLNEKMATLAVDTVIGFLNKGFHLNFRAIGFLAIRSRVLLRNTGCGQMPVRKEG